MDLNINVFISYALEDTIIANAIKDQLTLLAQSGKGAPSLNCFLDTESIQPGVKYEPVIRAALEKADWLVVVFTGYQSVYCGYEIGMYSIIKPQTDKTIHEKPVACLHDVEQNKLPAVVEGYNTTLISRIAPYLPDPPNLLTADVEHWWNSPVGRLLRAICATKDLYTPQHRKNNPVQYQIDIAQAASKITYSFESARQEDEQSETPLQAGLELIVFPPFEGKDGERMPPQSTVLGSSRAFEILGLNVPYSVGGSEVPRITWEELRQALSTPGRANVPWIDRLETNIRLAAALKKPQPDDVTFRGSGEDRRIYRAILTRYKLYKNGERRFYVLLVETADASPAPGLEVPTHLQVDNVHFTLTGQNVLGPGRAYELLFWVHIEQQKAAVMESASTALGLPLSEILVKSEGPYPLQRGSRLSVRIKIDGLKCPDSHKWITWTGEIGSTAFVVEVPAGASEGTYAGRASIRLNGCEIARMSFVVRVGAPKLDFGEIPSQTTAHRKAFASYASEDRVEVLNRIQGMEAAYRGLDVFVDVVKLRSGQNWEQELRRRVSDADVFYLFWCRHASQSDWVSKEWHWALQTKGEDFIDPVPLEAPELAPPPQELAAKHFNDPLLAFIAAAGGGHSSGAN
jgi:hypothetical protein